MPHGKVRKHIPASEQAHDQCFSYSVCDDPVMQACRSAHHENRLFSTPVPAFFARHLIAGNGPQLYAGRDLLH